MTNKAYSFYKQTWEEWCEYYRTVKPERLPEVAKNLERLKKVYSSKRAKESKLFTRARAIRYVMAERLLTGG